MSSSIVPPDLLDLRLLPAWVNQPAPANNYADFQGEEGPREERRADRPRRGQPRERQAPESRRQRLRRPRPERGRPEHSEKRAHERERLPPLAVTVRFLPQAAVFKSVTAQIKSGSVAYSVFALARLFLEKPERYDVRLTTAPESPLYQLGETGAAAADRKILEAGAFAAARDDFYTVEISQIEPLKGNFTNVARCRLSGTLLGPTNHHNYQPQLRTLYETRFSRRMSFADYQKQIEIVSDPAVVEEWKEQARNVTTFKTKDDESPTTFTSAAEAERHFRQTYLPGLLRSANELTIAGLLSRRLPDRALGRAIEQAWSNEIRSPSKMMQELAAGFRQAGLNIFRHRRGMLFVSPIRTRVFSHASAGVSASINAILEKVASTPGISRKQLAEQLAPARAEPADLERAKLTLAGDLHWLISEGYAIEFNDGSLDLPRTKPPVAPLAKEKPTKANEVKPPEPPSDAQPVEQGRSEVAMELGQMETPVEEAASAAAANSAHPPVPTAAEDVS